VSADAAAAGDRDPLTDRGRRTREVLVTSARELFEQRGFAATRMGDIADAAGVSHGTVYTYFADKYAVLDAVLADLKDQLRAAWRVGSEDADPVTRIAAANRRFLDSYRAHARLLAVIEQVAMTAPQYGILLADFRQRYVERAVAGIGRLQDEGVVDRDLDSYLAGSALCAMVEGFGRQWVLRDEQHDPEMVTGTLTTLWARALGLSPAD